MNGAPGDLRFAYRELLTPGMAGLAAGIGFFLLVQYAVFGPLGTSQTMTWPQRLGFWCMVGVLEFPICFASSVLTLYIVRFRGQVAVIVAVVAAVAIVAASCTAIVFTVYGLFGTRPMTGATLQQMYVLCFLNLLGGGLLLYYVLRIRLKIARQRSETSADPRAETGPDTGIDALAGSPAAAPHPVASVAPLTAQPDAGRPAGRDAETAPASRFFDRLPDDLGRDIIYLSASAHYVDVVTAEGSASILLRFSDAVAEVGDIGIRVHRSYWVAFRHVKQAVRRDGRTLLRLTGDHEVRVGRNYLPDVRAALPKAWLRARRRPPARSASTTP